MATHSFNKYNNPIMFQLKSHTRVQNQMLETKLKLFNCEIDHKLGDKLK